MKVAIVVFLVAATSPALAESCEPLADRIASEEGGQVSTALRALGQVTVKHPLLHNLSITCGRIPTVSITSELMPPGASFFDLVGRVVSTVTSLPAPLAREAALRCVRAARRAPDPAVTLSEGRFEFRCLSISEEGDLASVEVTPK